MTLCNARRSLLRTANGIANGIASDILEGKGKWKLKSRAEGSVVLDLICLGLGSPCISWHVYVKHVVLKLSINFMD